MNAIRTLLTAAALSTASVAGFAQTVDAPKPAAAAPTAAGQPAQAKNATHKRAPAKAHKAKRSRASGNPIDNRPAAQ